MKWLDNTLVPAPLPYSLCRTEKEFRKLLRKLGLKLQNQPEYMPKGAGACTHFFNGASESDPDVVIVCFDKDAGYSTVESHVILTHEAVHVYQYQRDALGEATPGCEAEAYAIQTITHNLINAYERA